MSAAVPPIIAFRDSCQAHALAVRNGAEDLREAGDALQNLAQALGIKELGGQDEVQALISATMNGGLAQSLDEASEQEKATVDAWERDERDEREAEPRDWPQPKELPSELAKVEAFDSSFLPDRLAPWINDISDRLQCPPD